MKSLRDVHIPFSDIIIIPHASNITHITPYQIQKLIQHFFLRLSSTLRHHKNNIYVRMSDTIWWVNIIKINRRLLFASIGNEESYLLYLQQRNNTAETQKKYIGGRVKHCMFGCWTDASIKISCTIRIYMHCCFVAMA